MLPTLVVGDCHFSHLEPLGDPHDVAHLWSLNDKSADFTDMATLSFAAVDHRLLFIGHYHRWWAAAPEGALDRAGEGPLALDANKRYFVVVDAVLGGWCAWLDTEASKLVPLRTDDVGYVESRPTQTTVKLSNRATP
jgi:hypothetical protein